MANFEFKLPDIGEGVAEGEIVGWLVKTGDYVNEGQDMVEVMTDKATVTIGAPKPGRIAQLNGAVGDTMPVGSVLVVIDLDAQPGTSPAPSPAPAPPAAPAAAPTHAAATAAPRTAKPAIDDGPVASAVGDLKSTLPGMDLAPTHSAGNPKNDNSYFNDRPLAAPATRKLARELGVDLRRVEPTGKGGRVERKDVERLGTRANEPAPAQVPAAPAVPAIAPLAGIKPAPEEEQRVPLRGLRKRIFENMARSKRTAAHFTYVDECEVTALQELRERLAPKAKEAGVNLTFLPFIVKAVALALKKHPSLNALIDDAAQEIVLRRSYDIGIAIATEAGLSVPVLRNVDSLGLLEIAREIARLADAARSGKIGPADFGGSSFTITSLGKLGGLVATPVINYPEVGILFVPEMKKKPVVKNDQIVIGHVMLLSLSFDHRVIDGDVGARFAKEIIGLLEDPDRLLLGV
jgi:pyruvate dehydrogenase E2 component (dihydrolipoamide acetyltransferase)